MTDTGCAAARTARMRRAPKARSQANGVRARRLRELINLAPGA